MPETLCLCGVEASDRPRAESPQLALVDGVDLKVLEGLERTFVFDAIGFSNTFSMNTPAKVSPWSCESICAATDISEPVCEVGFVRDGNHGRFSRKFRDNFGRAGAKVWALRQSQVPCMTCC